MPKPHLSNTVEPAAPLVRRRLWICLRGWQQLPFAVSLLQSVLRATSGRSSGTAPTRSGTNFVLNQRGVEAQTRECDQTSAHPSRRPREGWAPTVCAGGRLWHPASSGAPSRVEMGQPPLLLYAVNWQIVVTSCATVSIAPGTGVFAQPDVTVVYPILRCPVNAAVERRGSVGSGPCPD